MRISRPCAPARQPGVTYTFAFALAFAFAALTAVAASGAPTAFWSQAPDITGSKISSEFSEMVSSEVAGDFVADADGWVGSVVWWGGPYRFGEADIPFFTIYFYEDDNCAPALFPSGFYGATEVTITDAGVDTRGYRIFRYEAPVSFVVSAGTRYWVSVQAYLEQFPPQWGRLQSTENEGCGPSDKFRSPYFGHSDWVDASVIAGEAWDASIEVTMGEGELQACCIPIFGFCQMAPPENCEADGGVPQGSGSTCEPNPCEAEATQACCLPMNIGCVELSVELCQQAMGTPQGEGTDCDPDPCGGPATEACCFPDGSCGMLTVDLCTQAGGTSQGAGTNCDTFPCGEPPAQACCFDDGHCELLVPDACSDAFGSTEYGVLSCDPNPCPQPQLKPCCFHDKPCEVIYESDCYAQNGMPSDDGALCIEITCPIAIPTEKTTWGQVRAMFR